VSPAVRERRAVYSPTRTRPPESALSEIWERQTYDRKRLVDGQGTPVRVIYRGRRGAGPGPDFRDAIVAFDDGPRQGDVELHVFASDFNRHGHNADSAYNGVILHVVFFDDLHCETELEDGNTVPVTALALLSPAGQSRRKGFREPCQDAVPRLGAGGVGEALDRLGAMRFRQKAAALAVRLRAGVTPEQLLWEGLLEALGYGADRAAMTELARAVTWPTAYVRARDGGAPGVERALVRAWRGVRPNPLFQAGVRPGNRAERRLQGAAVLAERFARSGGIGAALLGTLEDDASADSLVSVLTVPKLVGRGRAVEISGNAVLPLAAGLCPEPREHARFEAAYASLPLPARYGAVRHLHAATGRDVPLGMRRQQGMLYLLRQYCSQGGCGKCPLS